MNLSIGHLLIILAIVMLVMGPSRLEGLGTGLGKAIRGFKKGLDGEDEDGKEKKSKKSEKEGSE